jgi:transposase
MADIQAIRSLHASGNSDRRISALLGVHRETVAKHTAGPMAPSSAPTGDEPGAAETDVAEPAGAPSVQNRPNAPTGSETLSNASSVSDAEQNAATGPPSACAVHQELIERKLQQGLSAQRIYQDLIDEVGYRGSYYSVRRFVARLEQRAELPMRRLEVGPGEEAQIDFGTGALVRMPDGKTRRPWAFRVVLSFSRKAYSEVVWRQTTEAFIGALENAFQHFGGAPQRLVIDNLKAAVLRGDWYDPEVHPKLQSFAAHYGTVFLPTRPYTPRHKGKIERGVGYVKGNALKARVFDSLLAQNEFLREWEETVADTRIHGTTKRQVAALFEIERPSLLPLPIERFPCFQEARRSVHKDGHLEVDKAYYSAPPEYVGRRLWVRWDSRLVRIFNDRWEQLAVHAKAEPGRFRTAPEHIPREKVSAVERGTAALLRQIASIGPFVRQWSEAMTQARGVEGVRVLVGLKALAAKHDAAALDRACQTALGYGAYRLRTIRQLLKHTAAPQAQFEFLDEHPVIRPLSDYSLASLLQFRKARDHERETD